MATGDPLRLVLVDDQPLLRAGFRMVLDAQPDLEVIGEAGDGHAAVDVVRRLVPDVVLMDIRMPVLDGIEATRQLVEQGSPSRILVLTTFDLDELAFAALHAGASGFLLKDVGPTELLNGIRSVAAGDAVVSPRITRRLLDTFADRLVDPEPRDPALSTLTPREHEVLLLVADGQSNAEIAAGLFLSEATVKGHVGKVLQKLGLRDRVQAVVLAHRCGLV